MIYEYVCFGCDESFDVVKSAKEVDQREICPLCQTPMKRIDFHKNIFVSPNNFEAHYSPAFGKVMHSKNEIKEEVRRLNDEKGYDLQEVGTEKPSRKKREKKVNEEMLREAAHDLKRMRGF